MPALYSNLHHQDYI